MVMSNVVTDEPDLILSRERVCLAVDVPELALFRGAVGIVRCAWLFPQRAYEVEFAPHCGRTGARLLLLHEQVQRPRTPTKGPTPASQVGSLDAPQ